MKATNKTAPGTIAPIVNTAATQTEDALMQTRVSKKISELVDQQAQISRRKRADYLRLLIEHAVKTSWLPG